MDKRLTEFSHGAGCGCKIAPADLENILGQLEPGLIDERLIVGNVSKDDAAVLDLGDGKALISTTDFFTPIVDDAFSFGKIAAANALSDIYAMGGRPVLAIAILGWPIGKLPLEQAAAVLKGAQAICTEAGIALSGGHSIDAPEPFFGLSVSGLVDTNNIKRNDHALDGDLIYITKPIGTGIISTAIKRGQALSGHETLITEQMSQLNSLGQVLGKVDFIHAMTDVTGFGLLGHLVEVCEGSQVTAVIDFNEIPLIDKEAIDEYLGKFIFPDNTFRNFNAYKDKCAVLSGRQLQILCDPQTNGGLLVMVDSKEHNAFESLCKEYGSPVHLIGQMQKKEALFVKLK